MVRSAGDRVIFAPIRGMGEKRCWTLCDVERGTVWEESILYAPRHVRIVALSATVPNVVGEDNLTALVLLAQEALVQDDAVKAARESATIANNQYKAGTANYLAVVVLQANALNNERTALVILGRRLTASVGLIKALGGGWDAAALVQSKE
jgi:hypothetical protein